MKVLSDTSAKARAVHDELLRRRTPEESFRAAQQLTLFVHQLALDTLRTLHPGLSEDDAWMQLAAERLGPDLARKVRDRQRRRS